MKKSPFRAILAATLIAAAALTLQAPAARAGETVTYKDGDVVLEGYLARAARKNAPVVMIVHQWKGLGDYEKKRAEMLAKAGYTAFAIDMYGQGVRPANDKDAGAAAMKYKNDPALARRRLQAAYDYAKALPGVDKARVAIIGYCFGGTMALELARSGADIKAAVSFHGGLASKAPLTGPGVIKAAIQVHHGADDPLVKHEEVHEFTEEMRAAKADWSLTMYGNAVHGFSDRSYGGDPAKGVAYNEKADRRSWSAALDFLKAALQTP